MVSNKDEYSKQAFLDCKGWKLLSFEQNHNFISNINCDIYNCRGERLFLSSKQGSLIGLTIKLT